MPWMTSMRFNPPRVVECENGPFETEAEAWRWLHVRWSLRAKAAQRDVEYATRMSIIALKWEGSGTGEIETWKNKKALLLRRSNKR